jgi:hypothetical protein
MIVCESPGCLVDARQLSAAPFESVALGLLIALAKVEFNMCQLTRILNTYY